MAHCDASVSVATSKASDAVFTLFPDLGSFGVRLFFGISGFLICARLIEENALRGRINLTAFYVRRGFRIVPPLAVFLLFMFACSALGQFQVSRRALLAGVLFLKNYYWTFDRYLEHLWSLAVEEHFYVLFPPLLVLVGISRGLRLSCVLAVGIAVWRVVWVLAKASDTGTTPYVFWLRHTDLVADGLVWGCAVAFVYASPLRARLQATLRPIVWWLLCVTLFVTNPLQHMTPLPVALVLFTIQAAVIPLVLVGTVLRSEGGVGRLLEWGPLRWVGRLSYSLYIWQQLFLVQEPDSPVWLRGVQWFPLNLVATFACSILSYYLIERPMVRLGHRLARPATPGRDDADGPKAAAV